MRLEFSEGKGAFEIIRDDNTCLKINLENPEFKMSIILDAEWLLKAIHDLGFELKDDNDG